MALVERTNSSELYEMRLPYTTDTAGSSSNKQLETTPMSRRSGSKKEQQQQTKSILRETASSSPSSFLSDDDETATSMISISSSSHTSSSSSRVSFVEDAMLTETRFYDTTAPPAAANSATTTTTATTAATTTTTATYHYIQSKRSKREPSWMGDNTLSNTDVFHKRLNRPAAMIQARVRGMIQRRRLRQARIVRLKQELYALEYYAVSILQARVRGMRQRQHYALCRAAIPLQAAVRGWLCRLKRRVEHWQRRLEMVATRQMRELRQVEDDKQREMQRIYKDLHEVDAKGQKRQALQKVEIDGVIHELRGHNTKLRLQNETLGKAIVIMAQKNERILQQTLAWQASRRDLQKHHLPPLQADFENISRIHRECKTVVQQYETALALSQDNLLGEKKISDYFRIGIETMLQKIENSSHATTTTTTKNNEFAGSQSNQKLANTLRQSCARRIRMALQEQEKANQLARGGGGGGGGEQEEVGVSMSPSSSSSSLSLSSSSGVV
jgi:IQ calmodulin-binding motif